MLGFTGSASICTTRADAGGANCAGTHGTSLSSTSTVSASCNGAASPVTCSGCPGGRLARSPWSITGAPRISAMRASTVAAAGSAAVRAVTMTTRCPATRIPASRPSAAGSGPGGTAGGSRRCDARPPGSIRASRGSMT